VALGDAGLRPGKLNGGSCSRFHRARGGSGAVGIARRRLLNDYSCAPHSIPIDRYG
jgi:hypothetical protein